MWLPQRSLLRRNWTHAWSMYAGCHSEVLDFPMGVLLWAVPAVWIQSHTIDERLFFERVPKKFSAFQASPRFFTDA